MPQDPTAVPPTDEQLAGRAQQGCAASFAELVRRFQVPLVHFLRRRAACQADAEDLAQETLIRVYEKLAYYRPVAPFATWLFTVAHRVSLNYRRRAGRVPDAAALEQARLAPAPPEQLMEQKETRQRLWDVVASRLPADQVTALWLYYVEDMPVRQIAAVLGRSEAAVKTALCRARKRLLPWINEWEPAPREATPGGPRAKAAYPSASEVGDV